MDMRSRVPAWLTPVAWAYIAASLLTAGYIAFDIYARRQRHRNVATEVVWISSALYLGPAAALLYHRYGRAPRREQAPDAADQPTALGGLPGGGASALSHLVGVPLVIASGLTIAGIDLWVMIITIGVLAVALLFVYERRVGRTERPDTMTGARPAQARGTTVASAALAAVLTVLAFDIGMGGWMLLLHYNEFMPPATEGTFWFLMQIGILLGLATGYPAVAWLTRQRQPAVTV